MESVLSFLRDLRKKNNRDWFERHKDRFLAAKDLFTHAVDDLLHRLAPADPTLQSLDPAQSVFRIYRDIRFSKDKTPYKTHLGAFLAAEGKSSNGPGYYFHIEPDGKSMLAAGLYQPSTADLVSLRERIAAHPAELRALLAHRSVRKHFPDGLNGDRSKVLRGFKPDHPAYDLLIVKSYIAWRHLSDQEVLAKSLAKNAATAFAALAPFNDWLRRHRAPTPPRDPLA